MLELRLCYECCGVALPPDSSDARICTFECTFCVACADGVLAGACPNCGGEMVRRSVRLPAMLARFPASAIRKVRPRGCVAA